MQFRGHSLPVRQSMRVSWDIFTSSHFISQFPPTRFPLITAIRMYHFLPVHNLEWYFWPGQNITQRPLSRLLWGGGRPMVLRQVCIQRTHNGGLGMPDLESHWLAERLAYLGRSLRGTQCGLVWFYDISTFIGYLTPNPFLCK